MPGLATSKVAGSKEYLMKQKPERFPFGVAALSSVVCRHPVCDEHACVRRNKPILDNNARVLQ